VDCGSFHDVDAPDHGRGYARNIDLPRDSADERLTTIEQHEHGDHPPSELGPEHTGQIPPMERILDGAGVLFDR
jgi:hypothetical protein